MDGISNMGPDSATSFVPALRVSTLTSSATAYRSPRATGEDHIETFDQLASRCTLPSTDHLADQTCIICAEDYLEGDKPEFAVALPNCGHVFGLNCIDTWMSGKNATCPNCREPILDAPLLRDGDPLPPNQYADLDDDNDIDDDYDDADSDHAESLENVPDHVEGLEEDSDDEDEDQNLAEYDPRWSDQTSRLIQPLGGPTSYAIHGEQLFSDLCESIVSWIEDPSIDNTENPAREWLCAREPFKAIIACVTLQGFFIVLRQPTLSRIEHLYTHEMIGRLATVLPNPRAFELMMDHLNQRDEDGLQTFLSADEDTFLRMAAWYRRIEASRNRLRARLDDNDESISNHAPTETHRRDGRLRDLAGHLARY